MNGMSIPCLKKINIHTVHIHYYYYYIHFFPGQPG